MDYNISSSWLVVIVILVIWDMIWRGFALWKAARNNQNRWFIGLLIVNSVGLLPILYLLISKDQKIKKA